MARLTGARRAPRARRRGCVTRGPWRPAQGHMPGAGGGLRRANDVYDAMRGVASGEPSVPACQACGCEGGGGRHSREQRPLQAGGVGPGPGARRGTGRRSASQAGALQRRTGQAPAAACMSRYPHCAHVKATVISDFCQPFSSDPTGYIRQPALYGSPNTSVALHTPVSTFDSLPSSLSHTHTHLHQCPAANASCLASLHRLALRPTLTRS